MIKAVIVEDEEYSVLNIRSLLVEYAPDVVVTDVFRSGKEALLQLPHTDYDLLFLDIQFNDDFDAFKLLEALPFEQLRVIFVTSYNEYAVKAFKFNAIDYITKPIDKDDLIYAIQKVRNQIFRKKELQVLFEAVQAFRNKQIVIKGQTETHFISAERILYIKAEKEYSTVVYFDGLGREEEILASKHLGFWEDELTEFPFLRIHKSFLVNMDYINSFGKNVMLSNGAELSIARDRKKEIHLKILSHKTGE